MARKTAQQRIEELEREVSEWKERADRAWAIVYNMSVPLMPEVPTPVQPLSEEEARETRRKMEKEELTHWMEMIWEIAPKLAESLGLAKPEVKVEIKGTEDEEQKKKKKKEGTQDKLET